MSRAVVLANYSTLEEALVVRGLLLARGLPVSTANRHHAGNNWFAIQALGGVALMVPEQAATEARQMIADSVAAASDGGLLDEDLPHKPGFRMRAISMLVIYFGQNVATITLILILILAFAILGLIRSAAPPETRSAVEFDGVMVDPGHPAAEFDPVILDHDTTPPTLPIITRNSRTYWEPYAEQGPGVDEPPFRPEDAGTVIFFILMLSLTLIDSWKLGGPGRALPEAYDLPDFDY